MIGRVYAIAVNTFREAVRDKILYTLLFFAVLMIGGSLLVADLTLGEYTKIIKDLGLASISIFGLMIAIFVGIGLVWKEIERKTIYTIASKPVRRWEFLAGKYIGLLATLLVEVLVMAAAFALILSAVGARFDMALGAAVVLTFVELAVVTALAILFGSFASPVTAAMFTVGITVIGKLLPGLKEIGDASPSPAVKALLGLLYRTLPDLATFDIRSAAAYGTPVEWEYLAYAIGYGAAYAGGAMLLASIVFRYRDFK